MTAGHCWDQTNSGVIRSRSGNKWFGVLTNQNALWNNCDCRLIAVANHKTFARLYQSDTNQLRTVTHRNTVVAENAVVRQFGAQTDQDNGASGIVETIFYTYSLTFEGQTANFSGAVLASYVRDESDSGAAVSPSSRNRALGIHSGWSTVDGVTYGRFFTMTRVEYKFGVTTMTD